MFAVSSHLFWQVVHNPVHTKLSSRQELFQQLHKSISTDFARAEAVQVIGIKLTIDQSPLFTQRPFAERGQCDFRGIGPAAEHRFGEKTRFSSTP